MVNWMDYGIMIAWHGYRLLLTVNERNVFLIAQFFSSINQEIYWGERKKLLQISKLLSIMN